MGLLSLEEIIKNNKGLVGKQLKKFGLVGDPAAISYGYEALYMAAKTYDESKSSKFSTYATVCIYNRLGSYVRKLNNKIEVNTISYDAIEEENPYYFKQDCDVDDNLMVEDIHNAVSDCYDELSNHGHKTIVLLWVNSQYLATHSEIAEQLGYSQSYVSQVINKFRCELKNKLEG